MKKFVIAGGAGFIGSNFIRYLLNKYTDYEVINFDKLTYSGNLQNLKDIDNNKRYFFVKGDICDAKAVSDVIAGCDCLINFAAETHVDRSIDDAANFITTNIYGTYILLEAAKNSKVKRFVHISTDEVYGSIEKGSFTEESSIAPNSPYAASKASSDLLARSYFVTFNLPVIITRSSNNFGPYQFPEKVIPLFITNALEDKKLPLYGDGLNVRDWLFVLDNCAAIDLILHKGKIGEIYNIGASCEMDNKQLTDIILAILKKPKSLIQYVTDRPGHDRRYSLDCAKIRNLGWQPNASFEDSLVKTVNWYQENVNWWQSLKESVKEVNYKKHNEGDMK